MNCGRFPVIKTCKKGDGHVLTSLYMECNNYPPPKHWFISCVSVCMISAEGK